MARSTSDMIQEIQFFDSEELSGKLHAIKLPSFLIIDFDSGAFPLETPYREIEVKKISGTNELGESLWPNVSRGEMVYSFNRNRNLSSILFW